MRRTLPLPPPKIAVLLGLLLALPALPTLRMAAAEPRPTEPGAARAISLAEAQALALQANLDLAAERARGAIARAETERAAGYPNLDLAVESARETPHDSVTLSLPVDAGRRRSWRIEIAQAGVATAQATLATSELTLRTEVRRAYFALAAAEAKAATLAALAQLAERAAGAADERFRRGDVARLEAVQSRLEATQAATELRLAQAERGAARAELAALLNLPAETELETSDDLTFGASPGIEEASRLALATSAELALLDRRAAEQAARVELARALRAPALSLQGAATFRAEPEFSRGWRAGFTLSLPSPGSGRAGVAVEEATLAQVQAERVAAERRIASAVAAAAARVAAQHEGLVALREQVLPQVEEVEKMAEESYGAGQTDLAALLLALRTSREARLRGIQAGLDFQNARADLERAMGAPLP